MDGDVSDSIHYNPTLWTFYTMTIWNE